MYEKKRGAFHCSWSIELYSKGVEHFIVGADNCYVICPKVCKMSLLSIISEFL